MPRGKALPGRLARRKAEKVKWVSIAPGKTWTFTTGLSKHVHDPAALTRWKLAKAGKYQIRLTYRYDRAALKKRFAKTWKPADDAKRPWNRALTEVVVATKQMVVLP